VSREEFIESRYSTVICAPVYSNAAGIRTEVRVGVSAGLKHDSSIRCDELNSISKRELRHYIGKLSSEEMAALDRALAAAVGIEQPASRP
jgi:mRNA interferase MazF